MLGDMKIPSKRTLIIVGVAVVIVVGAAWFWFSRNTGPTLSDSLHTTKSIAPLASVSPLVIQYTTPPADWKTYASASLNFSVSYPPDWKEQACGTGCVGWEPASAQQGQPVLGVIKSTNTLATVLTEAKPYLVKQETIKIGALSWTKLTLQHPTTGDIVTSHFIQRGSSLYEFGTGASDKEADILKVYGEMLASFKFLK
jgi:hypothetical protein